MVQQIALVELEEEQRRVVLPVLRSMSEIPTYCLLVQFAALKDVSQVFRDGVLRPLSKSTLMSFCVSHTVSSATRTSMPSSPACRVKMRNSAVLLRMRSGLSLLVGGLLEH